MSPLLIPYLVQWFYQPLINLVSHLEEVVVSMWVANIMKRLIDKFWNWYEKHYALNVGLSAGLFLLQLVHLFWLTTHVVAHRLVARDYFNPGGFWETLIVIVDYTEIPTIISVSLIYINNLRKSAGVKDKQSRIKDWLYLVFLNSQWLHILWITDEFIVEQFARIGERSTVLPVW